MEKNRTQDFDKKEVGFAIYWAKKKTSKKCEKSVDIPVLGWYINKAVAKRRERNRTGEPKENKKFLDKDKPVWYYEIPPHDGECTL